MHAYAYKGERGSKIDPMIVHTKWPVLSRIFFQEYALKNPNALNIEASQITSLDEI